MPKLPERLSDRIVNSRDIPEVLRTMVARSQKFVFPEPVVDMFMQLAWTSPGLLAAAIPSIAHYPFAECWIEHEGKSGGYYVCTDETLQRGKLRYFSLNEDRGVQSPGFWIGFDFTDTFISAEISAPIVSERTEGPGHLKLLGRAKRNDPDVQAKIEMSDRFWSIVAGDDPRQRDHEECYAILQLGGLCPNTLTFSVLNFPKQIIGITKDNFVDYNRSRRRLGLRRDQRQEYHVVRVSTTAEQLTAEAEEIVAARRREIGEHRHGTPKGEHDVRGHYATSSLGRRFWRNPHRRGSGPLKSPRAGYEYPHGARPQFPEL